MKRRVIQLVLLLVAGAIVNVAVAWGCTRWTEVSKAQVLDASAAFELFSHGGAAPTRMSDGQASHGFGMRILEATVSYESEGRYGYALAFDAGWPTISLRAEWRAPPSPMRLLHQNVSRVSGIETSGSPRSGQFNASGFVYPSKPLWPGFAINSIFYAAILWVVFFVPGKVKRTLRRRRGQCPACAYPIGISDVCTECGELLHTLMQRT